jgi:magnesium-transporting ATPase (P-type)
MEEKNDEHILEDLLDVKPERGLMYKAFTVSSLLFILCLSFDLLYDVDGGRIRRINWDMILVLVGLPVLGMLFYLASKKIGWIVNVFYYLVVSLAFSYSFYTAFIEGNTFPNSIARWRVFLFMILSLLSAILLFSNELRKYFKVKSLLLIIVCIVAVICAVLLLRNA